MVNSFLNIKFLIMCCYGCLV